MLKISTTASDILSHIESVLKKKSYVDPEVKSSFFTAVQDFFLVFGASETMRLEADDFEKFLYNSNRI